MATKKNKKSGGIGLPEKFVERLDEITGSFAAPLLATFVERPTTFRINTIKSVPADVVTAFTPSLQKEVKETLGMNGFKINPVGWYKDASVLQNKTKRELTDLEIYNQGKIYIQSLASMVPPLILNPQPGEKVLDLTAAPGSKTSQIAAMMNRTGELVANEINKVRFFKLKHNMELLGVTDEVPDWKFTLRMEDGSQLCGDYENYFDKILVDAPCSAESRFVDGDPKTYGYWSEKKIKEMAFKQRKLLFSAWYALKPGGTLVYSTCTLAPEENEMQISKLLERYDGEVEIENIASALPGLKALPPVTEWKEKKLHPGVKKSLRIYPTSEIEGFFVAKLVKK